MLRGPDHMAMRMGSATAPRAPDFRILQLFVELAHPQRHFARHTAPHRAAVNVANRSDAAERPGYERFVCFVDVIQSEIAQPNTQPMGMAQRNHVAARDTIETILARRGTHF